MQLGVPPKCWKNKKGCRETKMVEKHCYMIWKCGMKSTFLTLTWCTSNRGIITYIRSYKTFFCFAFFSSAFYYALIFAIYVTNTQACQRKTEKIFVSKEKEFYRIDSWILYKLDIFKNQNFYIFFKVWKI